MPEKTIGIALLGCGVIGTGVAKILHQQNALLRQRTGLNLELRHVVDRDDKPRSGLTVKIHADAAKAIEDPRTDIVIELIGGNTVAGEFAEKTLKLGKPFVTANKSLLAARGPSLFKLAREHNACIGFEASCGGGIPIINAIQYGLVANRVDALLGIVNGTTNFILTKMTKNAWTYAHALSEAQKAGFAEADPTMDVSGRDTAQKLAILGSLCFNVAISESDIYIEGIDKLKDDDIKLAGELGYVIKLLAIGQRHGSRISLRVHPTLVLKDDVLADVSGSFNAISIYGNSLGHALFYGRGAGQLPTASAVVADVVNVALGITPLAFKQLKIYPDQVTRADILPVAEWTGRYFLKMLVRDEPGVLAQITRILGEKRISVSAVLQHEANDGKLVPVVITTHKTSEGAIQGALKEINHLPANSGPTTCLRISDAPNEFAEV